MITTTRKLNPLATSCSTGSVSSSIRCWASFLNHSCSALSALIGPRQNSTSAVAAARTAPTPSIAFRPRMASSAGVPNRPNRNQVMPRSEEHTSELQSPYDIVCRLLLEKKKNPIPIDSWVAYVYDQAYV